MACARGNSQSRALRGRPDANEDALGWQPEIPLQAGRARLVGDVRALGRATEAPEALR